jgi:hypothetical protein
MKRIFIALILFVAPIMAADNTTAPASAAQKKSPPLMPHLTIPAGAKSNGDGSFDYTDEQGKQWVYRTTPFGVVRITAEEAHKPPAKPLPSQLSKVTDLGDSVRFEIPTPFGTRTVVKNKSELTEEEKTFVATRLKDEAAESAATASGHHE